MDDIQLRNTVITNVIYYNNMKLITDRITKQIFSTENVNNKNK